MSGTPRPTVVPSLMDFGTPAAAWKPGRPNCVLMPPPLGVHVTSAKVESETLPMTVPPTAVIHGSTAG